MEAKYIFAWAWIIVGMILYATSEKGDKIPAYAALISSQIWTAS